MEVVQNSIMHLDSLKVSRNVGCLGKPFVWCRIQWSELAHLTSTFSQRGTFCRILEIVFRVLTIPLLLFVTVIAWCMSWFSSKTVTVKTDMLVECKGLPKKPFKLADKAEDLTSACKSVFRGLRFKKQIERCFPKLMREQVKINLGEFGRDKKVGELFDISIKGSYNVDPRPRDPVLLDARTIDVFLRALFGEEKVDPVDVKNVNEQLSAVRHVRIFYPKKKPDEEKLRVQIKQRIN